MCSSPIGGENSQKSPLSKKSLMISTYRRWQLLFPDTDEKSSHPIATGKDQNLLWRNIFLQSLSYIGGGKAHFYHREPEKFPFSGITRYPPSNEQMSHTYLASNAYVCTNAKNRRISVDRKAPVSLVEAMPQIPVLIAEFFLRLRTITALMLHPRSAGIR